MLHFFCSLNSQKIPLDKFLKWAYNILTKIKKGSPKMENNSWGKKFKLTYVSENGIFREYYFYTEDAMVRAAEIADCRKLQWHAYYWNKYAKDWWNDPLIIC